VAPVFIRSLDWFGGPSLFSAADLTPLESFLFTIRNRAESTIPDCNKENFMRTKKPTGKQKGSVSKRVDWKALEIVQPDAAGIDVGGSEHWVAISPDRDPEPVRRFGCFTADLREMARWLIEKGVRSVAMQSTGVCWAKMSVVVDSWVFTAFSTQSFCSGQQHV
jgi:hypothetical protein